MQLNTIYLSDNIEYIKTLPDNSIDAIITDSPYGLGKEPDPLKLLPDWLSKGYHEIKGTGFMGKKWDAFVPQPNLWKECYRVLKPGGYLLSFFGTRTYDWGTLAIRLAGFEIRDCIQWIYGNGFPKGKACLKPANEPICVARKPGNLIPLGLKEASYNERWPSNVMIDEEIADLMPLGPAGGYIRDGEPGKRAYLGTDSKQAGMGSTHGLGITGKKYWDDKRNDWYVFGPNFKTTTPTTVSRFFYIAKASPSERAGCKHPTIKPIKLMEQLVKLYCPVGGVVLDPHIGSGTTMIAALNTSRNCIGVDNDPVSVEDAKERVAKHSNLFIVKIV